MDNVSTNTRKSFTQILVFIVFHLCAFVDKKNFVILNGF